MIELHPEKKMPLYEQLYNALAQDIRSGALQPGKALPGDRKSTRLNSSHTDSSRMPSSA